MPNTKKILVTGGAGYIGSHTVIELVKAGFEPIIIDNFSNSERSAILGMEQILGQFVTLYQGDCTDKEFLCEVLDRHHHIQGIIHFAAFKAVGESMENPLKYYTNNIGSTTLLLELMKQYQIPNFVFSSSCTVYGQPDSLPVTEESPFKPAESTYGNTKQVCEEILRDCVNSGDPFRVVSLRYFNPIGAHPSSLIGELPLGVPNNLVPFITQTAAGLRKELTVFGNDYDTLDGTCIRDYIHVVDLAKAHVRAMEYLMKQEKNTFYDTFNIGTGQGKSVLEAIKTFEKVSEQKLSYTIGPRRSGDVVQVYANVDKAKRLLGWKTELSLEDAMRDAWNWQKSLEKAETSIPKLV